MEGYSLKKVFKSLIPVKYLPYILILLSLIGFFDALYLTIIHYKNLFPPCTIGGCEVVLSSKYAMVGPFPTSLYGVAFYLAVIILTAILLTFYSSSKHDPSGKVVRSRESESRSQGNSQLAQALTLIIFLLCLAGLGVGLFLVYLQIFVLHSFCQYCLFSELIDFLMFDTAWWLYQNTKSI
ncbi:MAG TPA: vitamin K epoxide reductase family protein [Patescibacteria group bacterium]